MSLAFVLMDSGRVTEALAQADRAATALRGTAAARLRAQRGLILQRCGRLTEAQAPISAPCRCWLAPGTGCGKPGCATTGGCCAPSRDRSPRPRPTCAGQPSCTPVWATSCSPPTARGTSVSSRRAGATSLRRSPASTRPRRPIARRAFPRPELLLDRAEVLLSVGLNGEAAAAAAEAASVMARLGLQTHLAEAWLVQAQAALAVGDPEAAARRTPTRPPPRSGASDGRVGHWLPGTSRVCAASASGSTDRPRWRGHGVRPRHSAMPAGPHSPWTRGSSRPRRRSRWVASTRPRTSSAEQRAPGGTAVSPCASRPGTPRSCCAWPPVGAARVGAALRAGLRVLDEHRAALGATELRVHAASHGSRLAALGLRLALEDADAVRVLTWAEQWRAATLQAAAGATPG